MIEANGSGISALSAQQALDGILASTEPQIKITDGSLAKKWGWGTDDAARMAVSRQLKAWALEGKFELGKVGNRKVIMLNKTVQPPSRVFQALCWVRARVPLNLTSFMALVAGVLACWALITSMRITAEYGESLGRSAESISNFAMLSYMCEATAFCSPTFFECLVEIERRWTAFWAAGVPLIIATVWTFQAALGYATLNVSDTTALRSGITEQRLGVERELSKAREAKAERQKQMTKTIGQQGVKETDIAQFDRDIATLEGKLRDMPQKVSADPLAEAVSKILGVSADSYANFRAVEIAVLPLLSGLLLACATSLCRGKREDEKPAKTGAKKVKRAK